MAWQHHKGHNDHHYEYWVDNLDSGGTPIEMPINCVLEMVADWMAAGKAYKGREFNIEDELIWFDNFKKRNPKIHENTIRFIEEVLNYLYIIEK